MSNTDSHQHVVKTSAQWNERAIEYWIVPRGCLCVELTPKGKTKLKVGEGNKNFYQLPYICDHEDLYNYYTKKEVDALFNNLNRMAIMSTDEYDSRSDLPRTGNKLGDVRFVKSASPSIKIDPDLYVWNGHKWIFIGTPFNDITDYVTHDEFNPIKEKVDEIYPMAHTHANKDILDSITQADREKFDDLHNYDDTEIRKLIEETGHTHSNKPVLDQITQSDLDKLDSLHNYDDTEVKNELQQHQEDIDVLNRYKHTHTNKDVLDRITNEMVDDLDTFAQCCFEVKQSIEELKENEHTHSNYDVLEATTASYTLEDQKILYDLYHIGAFLGAGPTWDGTLGYVPAPEMGQQTYFLRGDGTWALIKATGDKYKAGEGITILSGEVISDTFPFEIFSKTSRTSQYIIYGSEAGVGDWDGTNYTLSITTSAPGETTLTTQILYNARLYSGDYVDYSRQIIHHSKQDMRQHVSLYNHPSYGSRGIFQENTGGVIANYNAYTGITDYIEVNPGEVYMVQAFVPYDAYDNYFTTFHCIFDENHAVTRYFRAQGVGVVTIEIQPGEKYARFVGTPTTKILQPGFLYKLEPYEEPCVLPSIILYADKVNTINVSNTNKPSEVYFEAASDESIDPEDPTSEFTGIIYNEGVLDVTQEDPNALNELTFHFRDNVDKTLTIPSAPLPIASDTTLGGIKVGNNLTIDPETGVLDATGGGGTTYVEGDGIEFGYPVLETYQVLDKIRKPSGTTLTTDVTPSGTTDFFCDLKYYKYAGDSFLILCYNGERGSFCYTPAPTASGSWARMWIYTAHQEWYDLYLNGSFASSSPIVAHLRWGNTMSMSFDHTSTSAQNSPGVLPGRNRLTFDGSSDADLYWAKFYENNVLVGELVPVIRQSDNAIGMFNKVTETFSTVSGLTAGTPTGETIVIYDRSSTQNISINAKLGVGLTFDTNDAITLDDSITIRFNCNNDPNEY